MYNGKMFNSYLFNKKIFLLILVFIIFFLGLKYRLRSYSDQPAIGSSTWDEQVNAWVGSSLINTGIPTGWSFIGDYIYKGAGIKGWNIVIDEQKPTLANFHSYTKPLYSRAEFTLDGYTTQFLMVQPYLEQPPLGALLSSFLSGSYQKSGFAEITLKEIRLPVVIVSSLSIILLFLIGILAFDTTTALFASLIYALVPTFVVTQRIAVAENYLTFFLLLGILFTQLWIKKNQKVYLFAASILVIICYLIKPFGLVLAPIMFLSILVFNKPKTTLLYPSLASVLAIAMYYLYGNFYAPDLFPKLISFQSNRLTSPLHGIFKIVLPKIILIFLDGWVIFSWIAAASLMIRNKLKNDFWVLAPLLSLIFMFFIYGGEDYGWYRQPFYPFLALASALILIEGIKHSPFWVGMMFLATAFATSIWWGTFGLNWADHVTLFRGLMIIIFLLLATNFSPKIKILSSLTLTFLVIFSLWLNIQTVNKMSTILPTLGNDTSITPFRK